MGTKEELRSDIAIPPGEYLAEVLDDLGMSQAELARRMGRPAQAINEIVLGKKAITPESAIQIEKVTAVPAHVWTGLEEEYRLILALKEEEEALKMEASKLDPELYRVMTKLGWVQPARLPADKVRELCRFLGVSSLSYVNKAKHMGYAFRVADHAGASSLALAAWIRRAELVARGIETETYEEHRFMEVLAEIRGYTFISPQRWLQEIRTRLATVGVALVVQPHLPKTYANGATFWANASKAVVVLSLRGAWADIFWFTLFHELGHVKLHGKREPHVSIGTTDDPLETEANQFAGNQLIPAHEYDEFVLRGDFSSSAVTGFGELVGISPGIVVGRLQHDGLVAYSRLNELRTRLEFIGL